MDDSRLEEPQQLSPLELSFHQKTIPKAQDLDKFFLSPTKTCFMFYSNAGYFDIHQQNENVAYAPISDEFIAARLMDSMGKIMTPLSVMICACCLSKKIEDMLLFQPRFLNAANDARKK